MCLGIWLSMGERTILEWNEDKSPYAETRGKYLLVRKRSRHGISDNDEYWFGSTGRSKHIIQTAQCLLH